MSYRHDCVLWVQDKFVEPIRRQVAGGGAIPEGGNGLINAEATLEFHRLYSAIFFITNMTEDDGEPQDESVFGDGLRWGGCVLVHVLGQQSRFNGTKRDDCYSLPFCLLRASAVRLRISDFIVLSSATNHRTSTCCASVRSCVLACTCFPRGHSA